MAAQKMGQTYTITGFRITDYMRVEAVSYEIKPGKGAKLVRIAGKNGQGKSSAIEALETCLTGIKKRIQEPVRRGASRAAVEIDIAHSGEVLPYFTLARSFTPEGAPKLDLKFSQTGQRIERPSDFLRDVMGRATVDPVAFINAEPRDKRKTLAELVGLDTTEIDRQIEEERRHEKYTAQLLEGVRATAIDVLSRLTSSYAETLEEGQGTTPEAAMAAIPDEAVSTETLQQRVAEATALKEQRGQLERSCELAVALVDSTKKEVDDLQERLKAKKVALKQYEATAAERSKELAKAPEAPSVADLVAEIQAVQKMNALVDRKRQVVEARAKWQEHERARAEAATKVVELAGSKKAMLAACEMPVPGLEFTDDGVGYNGLPFEQASHSEQVACSMAIALAQQSRLPVVFIRDASTLDSETVAQIAAVADRHDALVFMEIVAERDKESGEYEGTYELVIEEGRVVETN